MNKSKQVLIAAVNLCARKWLRNGDIIKQSDRLQWNQKWLQSAVVKITLCSPLVVAWKWNEIKEIKYANKFHGWRNWKFRTCACWIRTIKWTKPMRRTHHFAIRKPIVFSMDTLRTEIHAIRSDHSSSPLEDSISRNLISCLTQSQVDSQLTSECKELTTVWTSTIPWITVSLAGTQFRAFHFRSICQTPFLAWMINRCSVGFCFYRHL